MLVQEFSAGFPFRRPGAIDPVLRELGRVLSGVAGPFFTSMVDLSVTFDCFVPVLVSPSVRYLELAFEVGSTYSHDTLRTLVDFIASGFPGLICFRLQGGGPVIVEYEARFIDLFTRLSNLQEIHLPPYALTPTMFSALSRLHSLRSIIVSPSGRGLLEVLLGRRSIITRWSMDPVNTMVQGYFNLRQLRFSLPDTAYSISFFRDSQLPFVQLEDLGLTVAFPRDATDGAISRLFHVIRQRCPYLQAVELSMYAECTSFQDLFGIQPLSAESILPIAGFTALRSFTIRHSLPLRLTDQDVESIIRALPMATCIRLNEHPLLLTRSQLTVSALYRMARYCPHIQTAGLYFDCREPSPAEDEVSFPSTFGTLYVGASPFYVPATSEGLWLAARTLETLLPDNTELVTAFEEVMFDCREFAPGLGNGRFVVARNGLMEAFDLGWRTAHSMARSFRMWRQEWRRRAAVLAIEAGSEGGHCF